MLQLCINAALLAMDASLVHHIRWARGSRCLSVPLAWGACTWHGVPCCLPRAQHAGRATCMPFCLRVMQLAQQGCHANVAGALMGPCPS